MSVSLTSCRRAFAAAVVHDWFNLLSIVIFLPLEVAFGLLERLSSALVGAVEALGSLDAKGLDVLDSVVEPVSGLFHVMVTPLPDLWAGIALIVIGMATILLAIARLGTSLKTVMVGRASQIMHTAIARGPISAIFSGTVATVLVQSSSTTTSLMVPLAGSGGFRLREVYPFTLGANIGTAITAILAATVVTDGNQTAALQIALAHFLYNLLGVAVIYGLPWLGGLPLMGAQWLADLGSRRKGLAIAYILSAFFIIPGILAFATVKFF